MQEPRPPKKVSTLRQPMRSLILPTMGLKLMPTSPMMVIRLKYSVCEKPIRSVKKPGRKMKKPK